jgi:predicted phosphodiesterase
MKAALITDTHWGVRGDSKQFIDYFDRFYTDVFFPYILSNDVDTIFHLGDIVDRRKFYSE